MKTISKIVYCAIILGILSLYGTSVKADLMDPNVPGVTKVPSVYMPFENSNGSYGPNSTNPGYINQVNGDMASVVYRSNAVQTLYPVISGPSYGVKGTYFDGTSKDALSGQYAYMLYFLDATSETVLDTRSVMSHTITFWIRSKDAQTQAAKYANNYIMRDSALLLWGTSGQLTTHYWPNLNWKGTAAGTYNSYGQWVFVAVAFNQSGVKFYKGAVGETPVLVADIPGDVIPTGLSLATSALAVGYSTYVSALYQNFDLDEFRTWNSKTDETAALSLEEITAVWAYDYDPSSFCSDTAHPIPVGDFNGDCMVDLSDFKVLADNWSTDNRPVTE